MQIHTCLGNDVQAFSFTQDDLAPLQAAFPRARIVMHESAESLLSEGEFAEYVMTWDFNADWYARLPHLKAVMTPAAGNDWVQPDPAGRVRVIHGKFHGSILAESLLGAMLYMNHQGPAMQANFRERAWDRNLQTHCRLLQNQVVLIVGFGSIGRTCGNLIRQLGAEVIGVRRSGGDPQADIPVYPVSDLAHLLPRADHVALLLPGHTDTDGLLNEALIRQCKPGAFLYNFGRGNALTSRDVVATHNHIGGAWLDVTDEEPLPASSTLWELDNIMITPHSSCVYQEYRAYFIAESIERLTELVE